jgi:hypothetical protein
MAVHAPKHPNLDAFTISQIIKNLNYYSDFTNTMTVPKRKVDELVSDLCVNYQASKKRLKWQGLCDALVAPSPKLLLGLPFDLVAHVLTFLLPPSPVHASFSTLKKELALTLAVLPQVSKFFGDWFPRRLVQVTLKRFQPTLGTPLSLTRLRQATDRTAVTGALSTLNHQVTAWLAKGSFPEIFYGKAQKELLLPPPALDMLEFTHRRNRKNYSTSSSGAAWLALVVNGPVEGWSTARDQQLHNLHRPVQVVEWEESQRLKLERKKSAAAALRHTRALTKRALHSFLKTNQRLSIVSVKDTTTYSTVLREPWPHVLTQEWSSNLESKFLEAVYWSNIGSELRILEHQIHWSLECMCSTLFGPTAVNLKEKTWLEAFQLSNTLVGVADDLLVSFLATGNTRSISSFTSAGVAMRTAETLLQRIERVHKLAMDVQGSEPWYQTARTRIQLDRELFWLQPPQPDFLDWEAAWEELVYSHILPLGVDQETLEDAVRRLQNLPVVVKLTALRMQNTQRQLLVRVTSPLIVANAKLTKLLTTYINIPEHIALVQKARKVLAENGVGSLQLKFAIAGQPAGVHWWTGVIPLACAELNEMCNSLTGWMSVSGRCQCVKNLAARACTRHLCASCCSGCRRHGYS